MNFYELSKQRYAVKHYSSQPVEEEKILQILETGRIAPTAANKQPQKIYVLKSEEALKKARSTSKMVYNAPVVFLVCYDDQLSWKGTAFGDPNYDGGEVDASIVTTAMMMQATELGLGTVWIRGFCAEVVSKTFELPEHIHPVCYLLVGYPAENAKPYPMHEKRKELSQTVTFL